MTVARIWRERGRRYRLEAGKCKKCGKVFFPGRLICDACGAREFEEIRLSNRGQIVSHTVIRVAPPQHTYEVPYAVAIVDLNGGGRLTTQVADCDPASLQIGQEVEVVFRKVTQDGEQGIKFYGYKCVPVA